MNEESHGRKIIISSPINDRVAEEVISRIIEINDYDEQMSVLNTYNPEPIEMYINSGGGSATDGFAIIAAMEMSGTPIITFGLGMVGSMALAVFMAGDIRIAHRLTRFMYHSVAYGAEGYIKDHEEAQKEADLLQRMYNSMFINTKLTAEQMEDIRSKKSNYFFSGKEAVTLGFADEVILKPEPRFGIAEEAEEESVDE